MSSSSDIKKFKNVVFHNPHSVWFKTNVSCYIDGVKSIHKYDYIFDHFYNKNDRIKVLLDNLTHQKLFKGVFIFLNNNYIQFVIWVYLNGLDLKKFVIYKDAKKLKSNDVILSFIYGAFTYSQNLSVNKKTLKSWRESQAYKVLHLTHYGYNTKQSSVNAKLANIDLFVGESNLAKNSTYFQKHFGWYKKNVLVLPYVFKDKFHSSVIFSNRINKVLITGSLTHNIKDEEFKEHFQSEVLQPLRHQIYTNVDKYKSVMHVLGSKISNYNSFNINNNKYTLSLYDIVTIYKLFINKDTDNENKYYKKDIVNEYNKFKMFAVPEEVIGFPGIGFVEGMACGCAYVGTVHKMYSEIGLIEGTHYIGYNGTIENMLEKIHYYQKHENELYQIAVNGMKYVLNQFNKETVIKKYIYPILINNYNA